MPKLRIKHKYNIGDKVVIKEHPHPGYVTACEITGITITVDRHTTKIQYTVDYRNSVWYETSLESFEEYNKQQREKRLDYKSYINWLNKQSFTKDN